ncbi:MAG: GtrA family protein [Patescibacteria group bacterium]|jgi:putative flippase GtrA
MGTKKQILKFLAVGASSALLDIGLLVLLKEVAHVRAFLAVAMNQVVVMAYNFLLNKYWSFESKSAHAKQLGRYLVLVGGNYLASIALMYALHEVLGIHYVVVRVSSIGLLMCVNFLFYKHWVYKEN